MKTRQDILEMHHDSALTKLVEEEINFISLSRRAIVLVSGKNYQELQKLIAKKKQNIEDIKGILNIIEELIKKEKNVTKL